MSRIQPRQTAAERAHIQPFAARDMTRKEKTNSILTEILPMALNLGFNLGGAAGKTGAAGDTKGSGVSTSAGAARTVGAAGAAGTMGSIAGAGSFTSWAGIANGIMGALDIAMNWGRSTPARGAASGSAVGALVGTLVAPGIGTAVGAAIGAFGGGLLGSIKTGKHQDQKVRDQVRAVLMEKGIIDSKYTIGLADGSRFDIGYDGGPKKHLGGRRPYETDMSNPLTKYAISWLNPVVAFLSQGNEKVQTDFVGYFANAAISNAKSLDDVRANVGAIMKQFGLDDEKLVQGIVQAAEGGMIDPELAKAWLNGVRERTTPEFQGDTVATTGTARTREEQEEVSADDEDTESATVH
jgi:hypothetical protein